MSGAQSQAVYANAVVACFVAACATLAWVVYEEVKSDKPCVEEVHAPDKYFTRCGDPRARIVNPPGWSWFKCECPGSGGR